MGIVAEQKPNSIPWQQDILTLSGEDTGNLNITIGENGLMGQLNGQPFDLSHITLPLQWIDASAVSGVAVTLQVEPQITVGYLLSAASGSDTLLGGAGDDNLDGGDGDDSLWGLGGANTLTGGAGADSFYLTPSAGSRDFVSDFSGGDRINLGRQITSITQGDGSAALGGAVQLHVYDSWVSEIYVDTDGVAGAEYSVFLYGKYTNHSLGIDSGSLTYIPGVTLTGAAGDDLLVGTNSDDSLTGLDGNDTLDGVSGDDTLSGGAGDDLLRKTLDGISTFYGGSGFDAADLTFDAANGLRTYSIAPQFSEEQFYGLSVYSYLYSDSPENDGQVYLEDVEKLIVNGTEYRLIKGTVYNDDLAGVGNVHNFIFGNQGSDAIVGGDRADTLYGGWGNDTLRGGAGDDVLEGGRGNDAMDGGAGYDLAVLDYSFNAYGIQATVTDSRISINNGEVDQLYSIEAVLVRGTRYGDVINGSDRKETLAGGSGSDVIRAGAGNDLVSDGPGNDTLWGGLGNDLLPLAGYNSEGDIDLVMDFHAGDILSFSRTRVSGDLIITSYQAGDWEGLTLGDIRYENGADGTVRLYVGTDEEAGADYAVDIAGLGTGALLSVTGGNRLVLTPTAITNGQGTANADIVQGAAGDTVLIGGKGNDVVIGGSGTQVADMDANFADVTILRDGAGGVQVIDNRVGEEGADILSGIELLRLNDRMVLLTDPDLRSPIPSTRIDEEWYLANNPDVAQAVEQGVLESGAQHFQLRGQLEGRQPNPVSDNLGNGFSENAYLDRYADVRAAVVNGSFASGYQHYQLAGRAEGRMGYVDLGALAYGYDEAYYLSANPDVASAVRSGSFVNGYEHFVRAGLYEGRDPNALFDTDWYLAQNLDVAAAVQQGLSPGALAHFSSMGWREGRDPSQAFSLAAYLDDNPDVEAAGINPLLHYLEYGWAEGRQLFSTGELG
jgi:Ca2+-binding RTX toxin-like protein